MKIIDIRKDYHSQLCQNVLRIHEKDGKEYLNISDVDSKASVKIGIELSKLLGFPIPKERRSGQTSGNRFEDFTKDFIENCFKVLAHIRPGEWIYSTNQTEISRFEQYEHLAHIDDIIKGDKELITALGREYIIKPDIVVAKSSITDSKLNEKGEIINAGDSVSKFTPLRIGNLSLQEPKTLHASISCKWTIRSDRSQNTRTEALNLIRNRKGNLPHIVAVTAEPLPTRIAALALGTGDLDCVYHFALDELIQAIDSADNEDQMEMLDQMINGKRLRDISDLPFDLAV